jgi:two-component system sensor histidine kinase CpxA
VDDRIVLAESSADGQFHLVALVPPFNLRDFLPYYLLIAAAVALLWWLLAIGIASPIRQLTAAVGRFGRGDLASRAQIARRDEVGNLARAFDDMAERIQRLMTAERQLLQDISHELRSPLVRLSIGVELLRTTADREHAVGRLQIEVERLTTLVGSLLEVTRSEGDPSSRRSEPVDVAAIVREVVERCKVEADLRECHIVLGGDGTRSLLGDPELIRRAIDNVVRNAVRYAPQHTAIDVSLTESETDTVVTVRDVGPGVPEMLLPRLTDPFFRVDPARDANTGGVGLGLAIARRALHLHHGTLVAENAHPGLRVTLTIPREHARHAGSKA